MRTPSGAGVGAVAYPTNVARYFALDDEAVRAHEILAARTSIAIHHGTFQLGDDAVDNPKERLLACAPRDSFLVLDNGQSVSLA